MRPSRPRSAASGPAPAPGWRARRTAAPPPTTAPPGRRCSSRAGPAIAARGCRGGAARARTVRPRQSPAPASGSATGSIRWAPRLRALFTSVLTGCIASSSLGAGTNRRPSVSRSSWSSIEPGVPLARREDHRHAVMDLGHRVVGRGGDDRAGVEGFLAVTIGSPPDLPETGERQRLVVGPVDEPRLLLVLTRSGGPFVEAIGGDDAPALAEGRLEGVLLGDRLAPGVDHAVADLHVLGPPGHQAPVQGLHPPDRPRFEHGVHVPCGCDVVVRLEHRLADLVRPEVVRDLVAGRR